MSKTLNCDIAILGAGAGGLSLAAGAQQMGAKVILIESGKMGGDCLNYGCIPSKALIAAARKAYMMKMAHTLGVQAGEIQVDFKAVMQHVHQVIEHISVHDSVERFTKLGVKVIQAKGRFVDGNTLAADDYLIKAKRVVIATGSKPFIPPIDGLSSAQYYTNESIFTLNKLPQHLLVIGGGPIGCELAQAFAMLGSRVTLLEMFNILPKDDSDCVDIVRQQLLNTGVDLFENVSQVKIKTEQNNQSVATFEKDNTSTSVSPSHILVATGRQANVEELALESAGIAYTTRGVAVDKRLRTTNKNVFALGDVTGGYQFTHVANYHAGIAIKNILFKLPAKIDERAIPWITYTTPEIAHVGLTAKQAENIQGTQIIEADLSENDRAQADGQTLGKIKVIVSKSGVALGVTIVGHQASDLILPWIMIVREKKSLRSITDAIIPYPTVSELSKKAAGSYYAPKLFSPKVKRIVKWMLKFT